MKEKSKETKHKKKKKEKKSKHCKDKKKHSLSSSGSESDDWVEQFKSTPSSSKSAACNSRDDWMSMTGMIQTYTKDDIKLDKKEKEKKHIDSYNPATSTRELNPYWKDGGTGLPKSSNELRKLKPFARPSESHDLYRSSDSKCKQSRNDDYYSSLKSSKLDYRDRSRLCLSNSDSSERPNNFKMPNDKHDSKSSEISGGFKKSSRDDGNYYEKSEKTLKTLDKDDYYKISSSSWRKSSHKNMSKETLETMESSPKLQTEETMIIDDVTKKTELPPIEKDKYLSDEKMNKLAAKIVKAEIMGDIDLVKKLKAKLDEARVYRKDNPNAAESEELPDNIMLMCTNIKGNSRPLTKSAQIGDPRSKGGKRKADTHAAGERTKYFGDDGRLSLSEMFEQEKYGSNYEDESQLAKIATKHTNPNDELDDIFTEQISKNVNRTKEDEKNKQRAIKEHQNLEKSLEGCEYCVGSKAMMKHLMVSLGSKVYLAVPSRMSLTKGHCIITTIQHASCATAVDEDVWEEIMNFRRALVNFFNSQDQDVVFFETAVRLHKYPHLVINCVPMPRDVGDTAPIYFKKALLECEAEWSMNKKVVELKGKNVRKGVPKGLPYFWVDFAMDPGFAHVIEDQQLFPNNFAEEIIGGIMDLDHLLWKRPQRENADQLRKKVSEFVQEWKKFDTVSRSRI